MHSTHMNGTVVSQSNYLSRSCEEGMPLHKQIKSKHTCITKQNIGATKHIDQCPRPKIFNSLGDLFALGLWDYMGDGLKQI